VSKVKLTKNELRDQEHKLSQLTKYLPTLQLKKGLLQQEVFKANAELKEKEGNFHKLREDLQSLNYLFAQTPGVDYKEVIKIEHLNKRYDNIAGVDVPTVEGIDFKKVDYSLFASPLWTDSLVNKLQKYVYAREEMHAAREKRDNLEKELRDVSIRVNLFEKIMIPRTQTAIKKIKVFLSDQQLMAVCQAKAAQKKVNCS